MPLLSSVSLIVSSQRHQSTVTQCESSSSCSDLDFSLACSSRRVTGLPHPPLCQFDDVIHRCIIHSSRLQSIAHAQRGSRSANSRRGRRLRGLGGIFHGRDFSGDCC